MAYDDHQFDQDHGLLDRALPWVGGGLILALIGGAGYWLLGSLSSEGPPRPPEVPEISLVKPPPPPPPEPEMEQEEPPEPEMEEEEVEISEPESIPDEIPDEISDEPPPGTELGLDAEGGAGGDAFGLVGRKGGRGLVGSGGSGSRFAWYAGVIQRDIQDRLSQVDSVRTREYTVVVKLWLDDDGSVRNTVLERGTGDPKTDEALREALSREFRLSEAPPGDLPQPVRLRISSRT
jgi:protein TonB